MSKFPFARSEKAEHLCQRVVAALMRFGGLAEQDAVAKVKLYWSNLHDIDAEPMIYHEVAYYHAMCILHHPVHGDGVTDWFRDRRYWPPPEGWVFD